MSCQLKVALAFLLLVCALQTSPHHHKHATADNIYERSDTDNQSWATEVLRSIQVNDHTHIAVLSFEFNQPIDRLSDKPYLPYYMLKTLSEEESLSSI
jgi:hypothetical protein